MFISWLKMCLSGACAVQFSLFFPLFFILGNYECKGYLTFTGMLNGIIDVLKLLYSGYSS